MMLSPVLQILDMSGGGDQLSKLLLSMINDYLGSLCSRTAEVVL